MNLTTNFIGLAAGSALAAGYLTVDTQMNPPRRYLEVAIAEYVEIDGIGHIRQQIIPSISESMSADWAASITRVLPNGASVLLCTGSSAPEEPGIYSGDVDIWSLSDWTGGSCPDDRMRPGDRAEAKFSTATGPFASEES